MQRSCKRAPLTDSTIAIGLFDCYEFQFKPTPYLISLLPSIYSFELWGAAGGFTTYSKINPGGNGGYSRGNILIHSKRDLYLYVGSQGGNSSNKIGLGGFNGGADGAPDPYDNDCPSAGSGGATDIRLVPFHVNQEDSLASRIMVAGGGGSAGCWNYGGNGGHGGGIQGISGSNTTQNPHGPICSGGKGASQTSGYKLGQGEVGEAGGTNRGEAAGSGGGGYFGGFGGKTGCNSCSGGGGGGGSSFISGHPDCISVDKNGNSIGSSYHSSGLFFTNTRTSFGQNPNDGKAIIQWIFNPLISKCSCSSFLHIHLFLIVAILFDTNLIVQTK